MSPKEIREKRAAVAKRMKELTTKLESEKRKMTDAEKSAWKADNAEYDSLSEDLQVAERMEKIDGEQQERREDKLPGREDKDAKQERDERESRSRKKDDSPVTEETRALAFQAWGRFQMGLGLEERHEDACKQLRFNPACAFIDIPLTRSHDYRKMQQDVLHNNRSERETRALSSVAGPTGAYAIVPETLVRQLELNMLYFGGVRQVAETIRTASGEPMAWPTADDTTNTGAQLGENTTIGSSTDPSFGKVAWNAYKFSSKPVLVPFELLQDSAFDLASVIGQMLGERLGRITNTKFTTGSGAGTPNGIVTASTAGKTTAGATAITLDEIKDLIGSIDVAYRTAGCQFMMHDQIWTYISKLKDGQNRYFIQDANASVTGPQALPQLFGYPVIINNDMTGTTAGAIVTATKTVLFGQLNKYKIRSVGNIRLYRLEERYRDTDQDGFIAFAREDGNLLTAGTQPVKHLLQA